jgi:hypothetical protein
MDVDPKMTSHGRTLWRIAFFAAETAAIGSIVLTLWIDRLVAPLWRVHAEFIRPFWRGAGICALFLLISSVAVRRYEHQLCRVGIYTLLALFLFLLFVWPFISNRIY